MSQRDSLSFIINQHIRSSALYLLCWRTRLLQNQPCISETIHRFAYASLFLFPFCLCAVTACRSSSLLLFYPSSLLSYGNAAVAPRIACLGSIHPNEGAVTLDSSEGTSCEGLTIRNMRREDWNTLSLNTTRTCTNFSLMFVPCFVG